MIHDGIIRSLPKIKKEIVNFSERLTIPIGKHVNRKAIFATICLLTIVVLGAVISGFGSGKNFVSASSVEGVGVGIYWNQACTNNTISINWGTIGAGSNSTLTVYIKNEGNSAASLSLGTTNWTPPATLDYMSLTWNYSGQILNVDQVIPLKLILTVAPTIIGITNFSFNIIITSSQE